MKKILIISFFIFTIALVLSTSNSFASSSPRGVVINKTGMQYNTAYSYGPYRKTNTFHQYYFLNSAKTAMTDPCLECRFQVVLTGGLGSEIFKDMKMNTRKWFTNSLINEPNYDYTLSVKRTDFTLLKTDIESTWAISPATETYPFS